MSAADTLVEYALLLGPVWVAGSLIYLYRKYKNNGNR